MIEFLQDPAMLAAFLAASVRLAVPIAFAALGGVIAERSGVYNVGLEGMMLSGAFGAAVGAYATGSPIGGLFVGVISGMLAGFILAILAVSFRVNQLVAGIAVNLVCAGLTAFLARAVFGLSGAHMSVPGFGPVNLPGLSNLPVVGPAFFNQDPLVYLLVVLMLGVTFVLFRTQAGLNLRATGENPRAADSAGVGVFHVRYLALMVSGGFAALGGCHLVLSQVYVFTEQMSAGKGFIALAAIILGRWHPVWAVAAALFFGVCDAAQLRLQFSIPDIPYQIFQILPFAAAIVALVWIVGSVNQPEAAGKPYEREQR
ncbi:MAG: ABC transporter permease [Rhizobiales bacterium]|nr:ABC transporter permease [Hyphomicrobiales bacterium]